jgi:hypothetical protein
MLNRPEMNASISRTDRERLRYPLANGPDLGIGPASAQKVSRQGVYSSQTPAPRGRNPAAKCVSKENR